MLLWTHFFSFMKWHSLPVISLLNDINAFEDANDDVREDKNFMRFSRPKDTMKFQLMAFSPQIWFSTLVTRMSKSSLVCHKNYKNENHWGRSDFSNKRSTKNISECLFLMDEWVVVMGVLEWWFSLISQILFIHQKKITRWSSHYNNCLS